MTITIEQLIQAIEFSSQTISTLKPSSDYDNERGFYEDSIDVIIPHLFIDYLVALKDNTK